jgi:hypothetical protein
VAVHAPLEVTVAGCAYRVIGKLLGDSRYSGIGAFYRAEP